MATASLRQNQLIRLRGALCKMTAKLPDGRWQLVEISTGLIDAQTDNDLLRAYERKELAFCTVEDPSRHPTDPLANQLSEKAQDAGLSNSGATARREAEMRLNYVNGTRGLKSSELEPAIAAIQKHLGWPEQAPTSRSVAYWSAAAKGAADPIAALISEHFRKGRSGDRYSAEVMDLMRDVRDNSYMKCSPRLSVTAAVEEVQDKIRLANASRPKCDRMPIPARRAFQRVISEVPDSDIIAARYGRDAALAIRRAGLGGVRTSHPLERCEVDHTPLSIVLLDEDFVPWGRANASMAYDPAIGGLTGIYAGPEVPSIVSVARCMKSSITPKIDLLEPYDVKGDWPCFGIAETYVLDNGLEEHASAFRQAAWEMNSVLEFCPRKSPWAKPNIERHIRSMDVDLLQKLPGCTMENALQRCNFTPGRDLLLRRSTFDRILMRWIVDIHLRKGRPGLFGRAPVDIWNAYARDHEIPMASKSVLLERLFLRRVEGRQLDHEGVEFDKLIYNSRDMALVRANLGSILKVDIWVSDEDLGFINVELPGTDVWIRVPCLDMDYASGTTRWQHEKAKKMQRVVRNEGRELSLAESRQAIRLLIAEDERELKQALRKRRGRFTERPATSPDQPSTPNDGAKIPPSAPSDLQRSVATAIDVPDFPLLSRGSVDGA